MEIRGEIDEIPTLLGRTCMGDTSFNAGYRLPIHPLDAFSF